MGIDIRDGQQLECITCALCIDACDEIMAKIGKPRGLIDYLALSDEPKERAGQAPRRLWQHLLRLRTIIYTTLWAGFGVAMVFALFIRSDIGINVSPVRNPMYVTLSDGSVRNDYDIRLLNKAGAPRKFQITTTGIAALKVVIEGHPDAAVVEVPADSTYTGRIYITAGHDSPAAHAGSTPLRIWVQDQNGTSRASRLTTFNGRGDDNGDGEHHDN